ncbi:hydrogenase expression/formation protein [Desulfuromonas versatilis]|uniref:Hydrogenase expression/formation protein n=1 Tax=Desulfuromonas versatilis TaxID=2802975 RepID=A0ABM8I123_9BACT|nr:hydrogenase formation protein HypD [Desulfuromonas versatilis]BCR06580.1 hydrogenase expression/formation protein [Desulfuromonas versatilis]
MKYSSEFRDPAVAKKLIEQIGEAVAGFDGQMTLMEVCGTHTMAIYQHGIRALLPKSIRLISGPGCPVCVTPVSYVDHAVALARRPGTLITTFGDMVRVPGSSSSLQREKARGADVRIVYSPLDAVALAEKTPEKQIVFLGVGFETTTPTVAGAILEARRRGLSNFFALCANKTIPGPMAALAGDPELKVDGYICPAHVSAIIGAEAYRPLAEQLKVPCVVTGFEPLDMLQGVLMLARQIVAGEARVETQYSRIVKPGGNPKARAILEEVFEPCDTAWRGIGVIPQSGLKIRESYAAFDAERQLPVAVEEPREAKGCMCGEILKGKVTPTECPLFRQACTPENPIGACMVSSEGTCAAEYKYGT